MAAVDQVNTEKISVYLWITFGICFLGNILGGTISTLMSVYLPVVVKTLLGDVGAELNYVSAYINALFLVGWALGGFSWGMISDKIGRAKALTLCMGCYGLFTGLIHFASTWEQVVVLRLISGFGVGGVLVISATFLSEIWPKRSRSIMIGIVSIGFPIGVFSAGLTNYIVSDWRQAFLMGFIPFSISILSIWLLKESERWRESKKSSASMDVKFTEDVKSDLFKGAVIFGTMLIGLWAIFSWLPTWVQSLLTDSDGQSERGLTMMLLGAGGLSGGFFSGWISNALGVRKAMMLCFLGCGCMAILLFKLNTSFSKLIYIETAALALFFGISQGLLSIYIPQLFPVHIRATATGICFNVGRLVTAVAVFFVGALVIALGGYGNTILTFSTVFVIGFVTLYFAKDKTSK
ncbi:MFS transporter [Chryseolinea sp. H1M3-3]|uniref:MFS transporter n=1 Tax=Chryseolinea sp. H1M3-3 TaxID=3034144 RepID=UPI0023EC1480|nr:MFS transporter [Chryseolinea sp. H1M3-3]